MYNPLSTSEKGKTKPSDYTQEWDVQGEAAKKRDQAHLLIHALLRGFPLEASSLPLKATFCSNKPPVQFSATMSSSN